MVYFIYESIINKGKLLEYMFGFKDM